MFIGIDGMRQHLEAVKKTYPDYTMKIIRQYEADDYVISEFIMKGTHVGDFFGITPTNKVLEITGVDIDKIIDGKSWNMVVLQILLKLFLNTID